MRTALVTGHAGFIGFHLSRRLLNDGWRVIGVDDLNDYYAVSLKQQRLSLLAENTALTSVIAPIQQEQQLYHLFEEHRPEIVFHLAAQAGVRHSITNPRSYFQSNLQGSFELLEAARAFPPQHLLMASSSSVYGSSDRFPYGETQRSDAPLSFYAATKKSSELMAHSYAHLYGTPITMMRFFTVYGPWGRPDMAYMKFIKAALAGDGIDVYNNGQMKRDFTFIDDVVEAMIRLAAVAPGAPAEPALASPPTTAASSIDSLSPIAPHRVVNIGNSRPVELMGFIASIETAIGRPIRRNFQPMAQGDVQMTWADTALLQHLTGFRPQVSVQDGVAALVAWYLQDFSEHEVLSRTG